MLGPHIFPAGEDGVDPRKCPNCADGRLNLKLGRFGAFVGCTNYPECRFTRQIGAKPGEGDAGPRELGLFPGTETQVTLRSGRFGPYVQLGEDKKPKRSGLPKGTDPAEVDLAMAVKLLSLPREVGAHPEDGKMITANFGRFGPYVAHDGKYASLESPDDVFNIGLNHAVTMLAEKKAKGGRRGPAGAEGTGRGRRRPRHQGDEGPLWPLCHRWHHQCHHSQWQRSGKRHPGTGAGPDRRAHRQGRRQEEEEGARQESRCQSRKPKPKSRRRKRPRKKPRAKKKAAAKAKKKPEPVAGE